MNKRLLALALCAAASAPAAATPAELRYRVGSESKLLAAQTPPSEPTIRYKDGAINMIIDKRDFCALSTQGLSVVTSNLEATKAELKAKIGARSACRWAERAAALMRLWRDECFVAGAMPYAVFPGQVSGWQEDESRKMVANIAVTRAAGELSICR